jgi:hypothetical protein
MENKNCFVIIGYGKKTSYIDGKVRILDLDETYNILIKPVFDSLGIPCYRAIDKNVNGSIDKLMLKEIKEAYIGLADISTLNPNVMWELGVRHALKPHHTIMICEKAQMAAIPFDVNSFVIHQYTHSEEGIPYKEVDRFQKYLKEKVEQILAQQQPLDDSPVFTFLKDELMSNKAADEAVPPAAAEENVESFASIMQKAEAAKNQKQFKEALQLLQTARKMAESNMTLKDNLSFIISRQALCTYKSKDPNELEALVNAKKILDELQPAQSQDIEVLGLNGAINKRLFEITNDRSYLDNAIVSYERGFQMKQDYYNGINAAFMQYKKASLLKKENGEWEDVKLKGDYLRNSVLDVARQLETEQMKGRSWEEFLQSADDKNFVWVLYTMAEGYNYKKNEAKLKEYEDKAAQMAKRMNDDFAPSSYNEQKQKIADIFQTLS